jgi:hypothetical protein
MSARARGVLAIVLTLVGMAFVVTALPVVTGDLVSSSVAPIVVGAACVLAATVVAGRILRTMRTVHRDVRRGLRQIDLVLRLEAALATRQLTVAGSSVGCPDCGAPAGPHCVCRKR